MVARTLCPNCSYGCEFGVVSNDFGIAGVEYLKNTPNNGRLCPRGSAAAMYLDHPMRLCQPVKNNRYLTWDKIYRDLKKVISDPENIAVTFDRNLTNEEYQAIVAFCNGLGIVNYASTYLEPESHLKSFIDPDQPFSTGDIDQSQVILVIGDVFNQSPMISKPLIDWKLRDRKNRLIVVDSLRTHTSSFANDFLKVNIGTESLLLYALAKSGIELKDAVLSTGVARPVIENTSQLLKEIANGLILITLPFGRTYDPVLFGNAVKELSEYAKKKVVPLLEFPGFEGRTTIGSIINSAKAKKIKYLLNFGELFPYYYPQLGKELKNLIIYATSPLKLEGHTTLPIALNMEKTGTIITNFGIKGLNGEILPPSGVKNVKEILASIAGLTNLTKAPLFDRPIVDVRHRIKQVSDQSKMRKKNAYRLVGEKIAYYYLAFFEPEIMKISQADAMELGIRTGDEVKVESKHHKCSMKVKITQDVDPGVVSMPVETCRTRAFFDFNLDNGHIDFIPTEVRIWRKE